MRSVLLLVLLSLLCTTSCQYFHQKSKVPVYVTEYGEIQQGASMTNVMGIMGNPLHIYFSGNVEKWYYDLGNNKEIVVYFVNNKVTWVGKN